MKFLMKSGVKDQRLPWVLIGGDYEVDDDAYGLTHDTEDNAF